MSVDEFDPLKEALRGLRAESEAGASPTLESSLRAAFRKQHARRRWRAVAAFGAIAASLILASALRLTRPAVVETPKRATVLPQQPLPDGRGSESVVSDRGKVVARAKRLRRAAPVQAKAVELTSGFLPLPYAPPMGPSDGAQVVRVKLPRESMRTVGLPVNEDRVLERIQADVIVGQDGVARAIRFIQ